MTAPASPELVTLEQRAVNKAERVIIESLVIEPIRIGSINGSLTPGHFTYPLYEQLYRLIQRNAGLTDLPAEFVEAHATEVPAYDENEFVMLATGLRCDDLTTHVRILADAFRKRRMRVLGMELVNGSLSQQDATLALAGLQQAQEVTPVTYLDMSAPAPPIEWIVPGWLARREIAVLASSAGSGKSTTVADLCIAVATGRPWCSTLQLAANQTGPVLYFDEEQGAEEVSRLFQRLYGCQAHPNLHIASMQGIVLSSASGIERIEAQIKALRPVLVVLDTVAQVFAGVDLANLEEVSAAFRHLFRLRDTYGCTIMLLTHYRKAAKEENDLSALERVFGSVGFGGNPSTVWTANRQDGQALDIRQVKRRGARTQRIRVAYEENEIGEITLTAESVEQAEAEKDRTEVWIVQFMSGKSEVRTGEIVAGAEGAGFPERTVKRALNQLVVVGRIQHVSRGVWTLKSSDPMGEF